MIFQIIASITIISGLSWFFISLKNSDLTIAELVEKFNLKLKYSFGQLTNFSGQHKNQKINNIKNASIYFGLLLFDVLFVTAYIPVLFGFEIGGILLQLHLIAAFLFAPIVSVALLFLISETDTLKNSLLLWGIVLSVFLAVISILLSMFPLFGSEGQTILLLIHKISTMFMFLLVIIKLKFTILN